MFRSVKVAEWPPFWKELLTRLTVRSDCILTICNLSYFPFGFRGGVWVLKYLVPVPVHCLLVPFSFFVVRYDACLLRFYYIV